MGEKQYFDILQISAVFLKLPLVTQTLKQNYGFLGWVWLKHLDNHGEVVKN